MAVDAAKEMLAITVPGDLVLVAQARRLRRVVVVVVVVVAGGQDDPDSDRLKALRFHRRPVATLVYLTIHQADRPKREPPSYQVCSSPHRRGRQG